MAVLFTSSKFSATDANGVPLSGGKVYTYEAGTLIAADTYTTQAGTVANTNPVILNSAGRASIWLDPSIAYRFIVKDANDVTAPDGDVDNISSLPLEGVTFIAEGTGAVSRGAQDKARDIVGALDFDDVVAGPSIDSSAGIQNAADSLGAPKAGALYFPPSEATGGYTFGDVEPPGNVVIDGAHAVMSAATGVDTLFTFSGYGTGAKNIYVADARDAVEVALLFDEGRVQFAESVIIMNCGAGAVKFSPANNSCAAPRLAGIYAEDITGTGLYMNSSVNDLLASDLHFRGKVDYTAGLGKPRAGTFGWYQNTPVVGGLAVGGHTISNMILLALHKGMQLTDAQLSKYSNVIADSCSSYGVEVLGDSQYIDFADLFVGTTMGLRFADDCIVGINGLRTIFNGTIPPWGSASFYDAAGPYYDLTVEDNAEVIINGNAWFGDKRASVASTANLTVTGGQWMEWQTTGTVAAGSTVYIKPDGTTTSTETEAIRRVRDDGYLFVGQAWSSAAPGSGQTFTYKVRFAATSDELTVTVSGTNDENRGYGYAVDVLRGQEITLQLVTSASANAARHTFHAQFLSK